MSDCICSNGIRVTCPIHGSDATALLVETEARHRAAFSPSGAGHDDVAILNEREIDALYNSSDDDVDMASVRCVVRELRTLRSHNERMATAITQFRNAVSDARRAMEARGKGGQQVSFHGDFCNATPSVMGRLCLWAQALEIAMNGDGK